MAVSVRKSDEFGPVRIGLRRVDSAAIMAIGHGGHILSGWTLSICVRTCPRRRRLTFGAACYFGS